MAEVARGPVSVAVVPPGSTLPPEIEIDREKVMAASLYTCSVQSERSNDVLKGLLSVQVCPMLIRVFPQVGTCALSARADPLSQTI